MLYKGLLGTAMSGKVAGLVASHNKGGNYFRRFKVPTNPSTPEQVAIRTAFAGLATRWKGLTSAQRTAWAVFAFNTPTINRMGDVIKIPGASMYIRCNTPRVQAGLATIDDGPTTFGLSTLSPVIAASVTLGPPTTASIAFDATDPWNVAGGGLMIYASRPQSQSIEFFKGPYQLADLIDGTGPAVSPITITLPFTLVAGQRVYFRGIASDGTGRLSNEVTFQA